MSLLAVPIIAVLAFFLVLISSFTFYIVFSRLKGQMQLLTQQVKTTELFVNELRLNTDDLQNRLTTAVTGNDQNTLENVQVSKQLEHRIKLLQQQFTDQQTLLSQWQENQSQDKFYSRAFKLAEKGAGVDEIMCECELPRAEVEMLISVYQQRIHR